MIEERSLTPAPDSPPRPSADEQRAWKAAGRWAPFAAAIAEAHDALEAWRDWYRANTTTSRPPDAGAPPEPGAR